MAGVAALGFYIPRYFLRAPEHERSLQAAVVERSVAGFDEDELTMAVEAGERAIAVAGGPAIDVLAFASSGTVGGGAVVTQALGVDPARARDFLGSADAGETALAGAIDNATKEGATTLVIASDARRAAPPSDDASGAAAVALLVTPSATVPWNRGTEDARALVRARIGDAGSAASLLSFLASTDPSTVKGDLDLAAALKGRRALRQEEYIAWSRRAPPPGTEYSQGAYVSPTAYAAESKARYRLVGERCTKCGRLHFPPRESCGSCGGRSWEDVPLERTGTVYAFTIIGKGAAPSEFLAQQQATGEYATAVVELQEDLRVAVMLADVDLNAVRIGMPVRMVFRRIYAQEGATRYGFKFAPI